MRAGDTPVPIPNTTVKTCAADGTMLETAWESRWLPDLFNKYYPWGCSSVGRAPALQAGGQGFESPHLHVMSRTANHKRLHEAIAEDTRSVYSFDYCAKQSQRMREAHTLSAIAKRLLICTLKTEYRTERTSRKRTRLGDGNIE